MYMTFVLDESGKISRPSKAALRMTKPFLAPPGGSSQEAARPPTSGLAIATNAIFPREPRVKVAAPVAVLPL